MPEITPTNTDLSIEELIGLDPEGEARLNHLRTVAHQAAKVQAHADLTALGLPIPPELDHEITTWKESLNV